MGPHELSFSSHADVGLDTVTRKGAERVRESKRVSE